MSRLASSGDPVGQLYGYIGLVATFIAEDERGCDLANAAVELTEAGHPGLKVIEEFKNVSATAWRGCAGPRGPRNRDCWRTRLFF